MKISTRSRYGIRALVNLAVINEDRPVPLKTVAERDGIPFMYLQKLAAPLVRGGILRATRGIKGGVWFAKPPEHIKLSEVVNILEGRIAIVDCVDSEEECIRSRCCALRGVWNQLKHSIDTILENTTIRDLADRQVRNEALQADMVTG